MKMKFIFKIICLVLTLGVLTACGTSAPASQGEAGNSAGEVTAPKEPHVEESSLEESLPEGEMSVDMLYYLKLGGESIMARCYTEAGIADLGEDYFVVHLGDAEIFNAAGEKCALEDLTRGCPLRIQWPGMVMESYPGQIAATRVTALSDQADPSVPPEDEIPAVGDGPRWWVQEIPQELPGITMEYANQDFSVAMFLTGLGSWGYQNGETGNESISCGDHPMNWNYDDNGTCKRSGFDTVRFTCGPTPDTMTVQAYVDGSEEPVEVPVEADGTIQLLTGEQVIYVINLTWDTPEYWGEGQYGVKIVTP